MYFPPLELWWKGITGHGAELGEVCPSTRVTTLPCVDFFAPFPLALMGTFWAEEDLGIGFLFLFLFYFGFLLVHLPSLPISLQQSDTTPSLHT